MASALDKVTGYLLPDLTGSVDANLLGIDAVRRARGRGLLDAGLNMMALAGPRPATENINPAMILQAGLQSGMNTYDSAIDRATQKLQTSTELSSKAQAKETFNYLIASDFLNAEEKAFALTLGHEEGAKFIADLYMQKQKNLDKVPSVKEMIVMNTETNQPILKEDGSPLREYVSVKDILANPNKYQIPDKEGTYAKNIRDFENLLGRQLTFEEKQKYIMAVMNGNEKKISVTTDKNGNTTFTIGGDGASMEKGTKKDLEKEVVLGTKNYQAFVRLQEAWRPEFSEIPTRLGIKWNAFKESLGDWNVFGDISEEDKQLMADYYAWEQQAWDVTNQYIKAITGAQMSEAEAKRIMRALPDPRTFSGSPTEYQAKLEGVMKNARLSIIRSNLMLAQGFEPYDSNGEFAPEQFMILSSVEDAFNKIGNQMFQDLRKNEAYDSYTDQELAKLVKKELEAKIGTTRDTSQYDVNYSDILNL